MSMFPTGIVTTPDTVKAIVTRLEGGALDLKLAQDAARLIREMASQLQPEGLEVDLTRNVARRRGITVELSPNQTAALFRLQQAYPAVVSLKDIAVAIWGAATPASIQTLRVMMTELRVKLTPLKAQPRNKYKLGYRLELSL